MVEPAFGCTATGPAAHHEEPHRCGRIDLVGYVFQPAIEPCKAVSAPILSNVAIDRRFRAEGDITGVRHGAIAVPPRPHDQVKRTVLAGLEAHIVFSRGRHVRVVPARHDRYGTVGETVPVGAGA